MLRIRVIAIACFITAMTGCSPLHRSVPEADIIKADKHVLVEGIDVPKARGPKGCGSQALGAMIAFANRGRTSAEVADELPWHDEGATPVDLLIAARHQACEAVIERGSIEALKSNVEAGQPVLVMLDAGLEARSIIFGFRYPTPKVMHWAIVSGVAKDESSVLLVNERARHNIAAIDDFQRRWEKSDCCMIIVRSSAAPMTPRSASSTVSIAAVRSTN